MKIVSFSVSGLHGFIDIDVSFKNDITIIVGRNGSGKTSALNLIAQFLRLDISALNKTQFTTSQLILEDDAIGKVNISVTSNESERDLHISIGTDHASLSMTENFDATRSFYLDTMRRFVFESNELAPANVNTGLAKLREDKLTWTSLSKTFLDRVKLTFVRLDRTIFAIDPEGRESAELSEKIKQRSGKASPLDPIDEVMRVTTQRFVEYKRRVEEIKSSAFKLLLSLHFEPIVVPSGRAKVGQSQLRLKLNQLRKRVEKSALFSDSANLQKQMSRFFDSFENLLPEVPTQKKVGRRSLAEESVQVLIAVKEKQIENLLKIFDDEQEEAAQAFSQIKAYLIAAAKFLKESGKNLDFDDNFQLSFSIPTEPQDNTGKVRMRGIKELSSGERQVIIVLTYLAFLAGEKSIFIIDEPELSLHLRWQGYLIDALKTLRPRECQVIVATHAPEIVGRSRQSVTLLAPGYLPREI